MKVHIKFTLIVSDMRELVFVASDAKDKYEANKPQVSLIPGVHFVWAWCRWSPRACAGGHSVKSLCHHHIWRCNRQCGYPSPRLRILVSGGSSSQSTDNQVWYLWYLPNVNFNHIIIQGSSGVSYGQLARRRQHL